MCLYLLFAGIRALGIVGEVEVERDDFLTGKASWRFFHWDIFCFY